MPVTFGFQGDAVVVKGVGRYAVADLRDGVLRALADPACPERPIMLLDLRESESLGDRESEDVRRMAKFLAAHREKFGSRLAMVVRSDLDYGLMSMGSAHAQTGGVQPAVFRDADQAMTWLLDESRPPREA